MGLKESILDFPQETLNPSLWTKLEDGTYALREDAAAAILAIVDWALSTFKIPEMRVNLTGSNTSNSYSSSSDIDIHFNSPKFKTSKADDFNKMFRKKFEELTALRPDLALVNGVKTEVYMQPNPFQDLMSVGCYDFLGKRWLVGPDFKGMDFDPYAEYFDNGMKSVDDVIDGIRSIILQMYELSIALLKSHDLKFKESAGKKLLAAMQKAKKVLAALKKRRSIDSAPQSAEDAAKSRDSKEWKTSDSAFKLLDKFGYLKILQQAAKSIGDEDTPEEAAKKTVDLITDKISSKSLDDSEKEFVGKLLEVDKIDESIGKALSMATLVSFMAIPGLLPASRLEDSLAKVSLQGKTVNSPEVKKAVAEASKGKSYSGMTCADVVNAVARTIFAEAQGEGKEGQAAVASVIWNRAGGKAENLIPVVSKRKQFSCWNNYTGGWTSKDYKYSIPSSVFRSPAARASWDNCMLLATKLVVEEFTSTIGNRNSYMNKKTADKKNVDSWGKNLDLDVGHHSFGYTSWNDGFKSSGSTHSTAKTHVVRSGETLGKIAKDNNTTIAKILSMNKSLKDPDKIFAGQKIRVA